MRVGLLIVVCGVSLAAIPALAAKKTAEKSAMSDQQFVDFVAQTDMVEANLGQLAQTSGDSQPVKDYAQTLVTDHTADFQQISSVARQAGFTVPSSIDAEHNKKMIDPLEKLKGAAFDHHYVADMIAGHTGAIAVYKKESEDATNPALKSYAQQTLPTLEKHLSGAKDLEKSKAAAK
jgi:putative membrane protein